MVSLRVVLMSGYDATPDKVESGKRIHFLAKPFDADDLAAAVSHALGEP
jgi:ActR/RegA family two-component response regulator